MFCCLELVSCRLAVATDCRLELQPVVTNIPSVTVERIMFGALEEHDGKVSIGGRNITNTSVTVAGK